MRTLKALCLVALTIAALPAVASASGGLEAEKYPADLLGHDLLGHEFNFPSISASTGCESDIAATLAKRSGTVAADVVWSGCNPYSVKANSCKLEFHPGSESSFDIGPPGCGPITTTIAGYCAISIGAQTGLPATYTNLGQGNTATVRIAVDVNNLKYTLKSSAEWFCKSGTYTNGGYEGEWELEALDKDSSSVGITATDGPQGFFVAGEESGEAAKQPRFEAEQYPAAISGSQDEAHQMAFVQQMGPVTCGAVDLEAETAAKASALALDAAHSNCVNEGTEPTTVTMNSCRYSLQLLNSGPPYVGEVDVLCTKEGDAIETTITNPLGTCRISTPAQTGIGGSVSVVNFGSGASRGVTLDLDLEGIKSTTQATGFGACAFAPKEVTNGTYTGTTDLNGYWQ